MEEQSAVDVLTTVFLWLSVAAGAAFGWLGTGNVLSMAAGAVIFGVFGLVLVGIISVVAHLISQFIERLSRR